MERPNGSGLRPGYDCWASAEAGEGLTSTGFEGVVLLVKSEGEFCLFRYAPLCANDLLEARHPRYSTGFNFTQYLAFKG